MSQAPAVDYAIRIIEYFSEREAPLGITEIGSALGINKSAVSRILGSLVESGWVYCCDTARKKYALTLRPFSCVSRCVAGDGLRRLASPYVDAYHEETGDCVYLGILNMPQVLYILHHPSNGDVQIVGRVGGQYPLHCSAAGKILLAEFPEEEMKDYFPAYGAARTPNTVTDFSSFQKEAEGIREKGFATDNEEFGKGIICLAVPVYDAEEKVVAALGTSTLTCFATLESYQRDRLPKLLDTAEKISRALGSKRSLPRRPV